MTETPVLKCPICGIEILPSNPFKPFCSKRHKEIDLNRWFSEIYRIETDEAPETESEERPPEDKRST